MQGRFLGGLRKAAKGYRHEEQQEQVFHMTGYSLKIRTGLRNEQRGE
jgi:hypothetical protein